MHMHAWAMVEIDARISTCEAMLAALHESLPARNRASCGALECTSPCYRRRSEYPKGKEFIWIGFQGKRRTGTCARISISCSYRDLHSIDLLRSADRARGVSIGSASSPVRAQEHAPEPRPPTMASRAFVLVLAALLALCAAAAPIPHHQPGQVQEGPADDLRRPQRQQAQVLGQVRQAVP